MIRGFLIFFLAFSFSCGANSVSKNSNEKKSAGVEKGLISDSAMVVSAHPEATRVGVEILRRGGNAYDAAVAVQFALAVVYPQAGNIGGGGFMVSRNSNGEFDCLDFRETAPAGASVNMFLDPEGNVIPDLSMRGHLASGIPGSVMGMMMIHKKYGSLAWNELVQPAVMLAENGFPLTEREAALLNGEQENFRRYNSSVTYMQRDSAWRKGDILVQTDLAETLKRIAETGGEDFYTGRTADLLVAEMKSGNGLISKDDLKNYTAVWRTPLKQKVFSEYTIVSMPPPSSGGVAVLQIISLLEFLRIDTVDRQSAGYINYVAEVEKLAYSDRSEYLGDPDFYSVPLERLLDSNYLRSRLQKIKVGRVTPSSEISPGTISMIEGEHTTHFSIVDQKGNAVSLTTTINSSFGSRVFVRGAGFLLNNEMDDFSSKPGVPNQFGLLGNSANSIEPGKRMLSSMTPTIVEKNGRLFMVVGSPGGATIITSVVQNILNVMIFKMGMQASVNCARFHHQWMPDELFVEQDLLDSLILGQLRSFGYTVHEREPIGRVDAILVLDNGKLEAGADKRGDDTAGGF